MFLKVRMYYAAHHILCILPKQLWKNLDDYGVKDSSLRLVGLSELLRLYQLELSKLDYKDP